MDYIKKKQKALKGGDKLSKDDKEKLEQAKKSKQEALQGKIDAVSGRMKEIASSPAMKKFSSLVKNKADLEASKKLLKVAQGEENSALKVKLEDKVDQLKDSITNKEDELKNYSKKADKSNDSNDSNDSDDSKKSGKSKNSNESISLKKQDFKEEKIMKEKVQNQLTERINVFRNELTTNPEYNRTPQARSEVERRISRWEQTVSEMNEKNFLSYESSINLDMNQLPTDLQSINSKQEQANNPQVQQAMQEAQSLGNPGQANPEQTNSENAQKLDKTREAMRRAGLL